MLEGLLRLVSIERPPAEMARDFLDILIVAFIVYRALMVLKGTRAMQMGIGFVAFGALYLLAKWAQFATLISVLSWLASSAILIVVVVFQNDIRRALIRVGSKAWLTRGPDAQERVIDEICAAATELARHRMGAIIALERDADVMEFVRSKGIEIDSVVTKELLVSLFIPESANKTHDGAVLIRDHRIHRAGVFFQMPEEAKIEDPTLGSRHRASIGITENTDALVIVVSEERGTITLFFNTNSVLHLTADNLRDALFGLFGRPEKRKRFFERVTSGLTRKATLTADRAIAKQEAKADKAEPTSGRVTRPSKPPPPEISIKAGSSSTIKASGSTIKASGSTIKASGSTIKAGGSSAIKTSSSSKNTAIKPNTPIKPKPTIKASGPIKPTKQSGRFRAVKGADKTDEPPKSLPRVSVPMPSATDKEKDKVDPDDEAVDAQAEDDSPKPPPAVSKPMTPTELPSTVLRGSDDT